MRKTLFLVIVLVGAIPLALNALLVLREAQPGSDLTGLVVATTITGALLLLLALLATRWLSRGLDQDLAGVSQAVDRIADGKYHGWMRYRGSNRETRDLSLALNRLAGNLADEEAILQREEAESRAVATQSLEFIEELLKAKVPLAKHHPGLVEAYSRELVAKTRQVDEEPGSRNLVRGVMDAVLGKKERHVARRSYPRYLAKTLWTESPVPARIIDLSMSGMCVESLESPQRENPTSFTIVNGEERFSVPARVQWCRLVATDEVREGERVAVYRAGAEFLEDLPQRTLERLLETLESQFEAAALQSR